MSDNWTIENEILEAFLLESTNNLAIHHNRKNSSMVNYTSLNHEVSKMIN